MIPIKPIIKGLQKTKYDSNLELLYSKFFCGVRYSFYVDNYGKLRASTNINQSELFALQIKGLPAEALTNVDKCGKKNKIVEMLNNSYFISQGFDICVRLRGPGGWDEKIHQGYKSLHIPFKRLHEKLSGICINIFDRFNARDAYLINTKLGKPHGAQGTYLWAQETGFSKHAAARVAFYDNQVDFDLTTNPSIPPRRKTQAWHFNINYPKVKDMSIKDSRIQRGLNSLIRAIWEYKILGAKPHIYLNHLGKGLHPLQDVFAHERPFVTSKKMWKIHVQHHLGKPYADDPYFICPKHSPKTTVEEPEACVHKPFNQRYSNAKTMSYIYLLFYRMITDGKFSDNRESYLELIKELNLRNRVNAGGKNVFYSFAKEFQKKCLAHKQLSSFLKELTALDDAIKIIFNDSPEKNLKPPVKFAYGKSGVSSIQLCCCLNTTFGNVDQESKQKKRRLWDLKKTICSLAILPNGNVITGCSDGIIKIFKVDRDKWRTIGTGDGAITSLVSLSSSRFISGADGVICMRDSTTGRELAKLRLGDGQITSLKLLGSDTLLCGVDNNGTSERIYVVYTGKWMETSYPNYGDVKSIVLLPKGEFALPAKDNIGVVICSTKDGAVKYKIGGNKRGVCLCYVDGVLIIGGDTKDATIRFWDIKTKKLLHEIKGYSGQISGITTYCERFVAALWENGVIKIFDPKAGKCIGIVEDSKENNSSIVIEGADGQLITASNNGLLSIHYISKLLKKRIDDEFNGSNDPFDDFSSQNSADNYPPDSPDDGGDPTIFNSDTDDDFDDTINLGNSGTNSEYWYSVQDGYILAMDIRRRRFTYQNHNGQAFRSPGNENYSAARQNAQNIFVSDPYNVTQFNNRFPIDIDIITGRRAGEYIRENNRWTRMPRILVISFIADGHWLGARVQVNYTAGTADILFDDSFGGEHTDFVRILETIIIGIQTLIRTQRNNNKFLLRRNQITIRYKSFIQQDNGFDCGPIRFQNASDHVNPNVSNENFALSDQYYRIKQASTKNRDKIIKDVRIRDGNIYRRITGNDGGMTDAYREKIINAKKEVARSRQTKFKPLLKNGESSKIIQQINHFGTRWIRLFHESIEQTRILTKKNIGKLYTYNEILSAYKYILTKLERKEKNGSKYNYSEQLVNKQIIDDANVLKGKYDELLKILTLIEKRFTEAPDTRVLDKAEIEKTLSQYKKNEQTNKLFSQSILLSNKSQEVDQQEHDKLVDGIRTKIILIQKHIEELQKYLAHKFSDVTGTRKIKTGERMKHNYKCVRVCCRKHKRWHWKRVHSGCQKIPIYKTIIEKNELETNKLIEQHRSNVLTTCKLLRKQIAECLSQVNQVYQKFQTKKPSSIQRKESSISRKKQANKSRKTNNTSSKHTKQKSGSVSRLTAFFDKFHQDHKKSPGGGSSSQPSNNDSGFNPHG